jgi:flagellar biogenesis protein FliO
MKKKHILPLVILFLILFLLLLVWRFGFKKSFNNLSRNIPFINNSSRITTQEDQSAILTVGMSQLSLGVEKMPGGKYNQDRYSVVGVITGEIYQDGDEYILPIMTGETGDIRVDLVLGKGEDTFLTEYAKNGKVETVNEARERSVAEVIPLLDKGDQIQVRITTSFPDEWMNLPKDKCDLKCQRSVYFVERYGPQSQQFLEKVIKGEQVQQGKKLGWVSLIQLGVKE